MNKHFWLRTPGAAVPARWTEAFPAGEAIGLQQLLGRPDAGADAQRLVWLAAADLHWLDHLHQVLGALPSERVVVLSPMPDDKDALRAVAAGARGYAHTHAVPALLQELALVVEHGGYWLGPGPMRLLVEHGATAIAAPAAQPQGAASWQRLSAREADVALAVHEGRSNKEIASLLGISERTVKAHLGAAFEKLGVRDRLQLALRLSGPAVERVTPTALSPPTRPPPEWNRDLAHRPAAVAPVPSSNVPPSNRNVTGAGLT
jgi:DNA-binding NarL/FixJ family response regulator